MQTSGFAALSAQMRFSLASAICTACGTAFGQCYQVLPLPAPNASVTYTRAIASDCSADGNVVVGEATTNTNTRRAVIWDGNTFAFMDDFTNPQFTAVAVSGNGRYVGGKHRTLFYAYRYDRQTGQVDAIPVIPGEPDGEVQDINADGSVVVGRSGQLLFRWSPAFGLQNLGRPAGSYSLVNSDVSADGNVIAATFNRIGSGSGDFIHTVWTPTGGLQVLDDPAGPNSQVTQISRDGQLVLNADGFGPGWIINRSNGSATSLPMGPGNADWEATDIALNGAVIAGKRITGGNSLFAYHPTLGVVNGWQRAGVPEVPISGFAIMLSEDGSKFVATNSDQRAFRLCQPAWPSVGGGCDTIDFNRDGVSPDNEDLRRFLNAFGGNQCSGCGDIDFNNDNIFPDSRDIEAFIRVMGGGNC